MSEWIKLYAAVFTHPKTRRLAKRLDVSPAAAVGHLASLWAFAAEFAPDGDLSRFEGEEIELGAGWDGPDGAFVAAASVAGYLDADGERVMVHDWSDYGGRIVEKRAAERKRKAASRASAGRQADNQRTDAGRPQDNQRTASRACAGQREEREEREPPLPPQPVENSGPPASVDDPGEEQAPPEERGLEACRLLAPCDPTAESCEVRALHVGIRSQVTEIVGPENAGKLYNPASPIHKALAGMAGYVCDACHSASAGPGVTMADRQTICRQALREYVAVVLEFHRAKPIRSLPAFLRTRYAHMTEAPVSDGLLEQLRALERRGTNGKGEPQRVSGLLPGIPAAAQPHDAAKHCNLGDSSAA